jgi:hypothetical protein
MYQLSSMADTACSSPSARAPSASGGGGGNGIAGPNCRHHNYFYNLSKRKRNITFHTKQIGSFAIMYEKGNFQYSNKGI